MHRKAIRAEYEHRKSTPSDIVDHLPILNKTIYNHPMAWVLELGVRSGNSTAAFLPAVEDMQGHLWSVDIERPNVPDWWHELEQWSLIVGDDTSAEVADRLPKQLDVLFIDTSHAYDHTLTELRTYVPRVRPGGTVLLHDTEVESPEGVGANPPYPVARALDTFCQEAGMSWVNQNGCNGLGVIGIER